MDDTPELKKEAANAASSGERHATFTDENGINAMELDEDEEQQNNAVQSGSTQIGAGEGEDLEENEEDFEESGGAEEDALPENAEVSETASAAVISPLVLRKIKPEYSEKFRPGDVCAVIQQTMREVIVDKVYVAEEVQGWIKQMAQLINDRVKELQFHRYKIITQVTIGELRGQGSLAATKCMWDEDSDYYSTFSFRNNSLFCTVTVYGVYYY